MKVFYSCSFFSTSICWIRIVVFSICVFYLFVCFFFDWCLLSLFLHECFGFFHVEYTLFSYLDRKTFQNECVFVHFFHMLNFSAFSCDWREFVSKFSSLQKFEQNQISSCKFQLSERMVCWTSFRLLNFISFSEFEWLAEQNYSEKVIYLVREHCLFSFL